MKKILKWLLIGFIPIILFSSYLDFHIFDDASMKMYAISSIIEYSIFVFGVWVGTLQQ